MSLLVKNGTIITADSEYIADIYIDDEKIVAIGEDLSFKADEVLDATGKCIFPGRVNEHVHYG